MVRGATDKETNDIQARLPVAGHMERHFRSLRGIYFIDPADGQRDGVFKACLQQAADPRGSRTCVCANIFGSGAAQVKCELASCRGTVKSAW